MRSFLVRRTRHLFIVKKSVLAAVLMIAAVAGIFGAVSIPTVVETAAATRQLPIYSVECTGKRCSLSFDAAWGNEDTQLVDAKGGDT